MRDDLLERRLAEVIARHTHRSGSDIRCVHSILQTIDDYGLVLIPKSLVKRAQEARGLDGSTFDREVVSNDLARYGNLSEPVGEIPREDTE